MDAMTGTPDASVLALISSKNREWHLSNPKNHPSFLYPNIIRIKGKSELKQDQIET
jgi:hypothetical protein